MKIHGPSRGLSLSFLGALLVGLLVFGGPSQLFAQYPPTKELAKPSSTLQDLKGKRIDVWFTDGNSVADAEVVAVKAHKTQQTPTSIRLKVTLPPKITKSGRVSKKKNTKSKWFSARKIDEIYLDNRPLDVTYNKKYKTLEFDSEKRAKRIAHQNQVRKQLAKTRNRYWTNLTEKEQEAYKKKLDAFLEKAKERLAPTKLQSQETKFFVLCTDLPPQQANFYLFQLDAMYKKLSKAFGLCPDKNIWAGKCLAFVFNDQDTFLQFETLFHEFEPGLPKSSAPPEDAVGLCHQLPDGRVIFAGYQGQNPYFSNTIVHETTHGFVFRYMSNVRLPSWLNEGVSDWASAQIAGKRSVILKQRASVAEVRRTLTWGRTFLTAPRISARQYGIASMVVDMLVKAQKKDEFRQFINLIKEGHSAEDALKQAYETDFEQLENAYVLKVTGKPKPKLIEGEGEAAGDSEAKGRTGNRGRGSRNRP